MNKIILALVATTALTMPAMAEELPRPGTADDKVQFAVYDPNNVVRIIGTQLRSTMIQFAPTETVEVVALGDLKAWNYQKVNNLLFVKPSVDPARDTNMQVVTLTADKQQRVYQFDLMIPKTGTVEASDPVYSINFSYPADQAAARQKEYQEKQAKVDEDLARQRLEVSVYYGDRNWRFLGRGSAALRPTNVSDNGQQTAFRFPGNTKIPAIYELTPDGKEQIANYRMEQDFAVVDGTAKGWVLRMGNEVYDVWNIGYDPVGFNPRTGTTSPDVVRTVHAPVVHKKVSSQ